MTNTAHLTELGHSPDALAQRQADLLALLRQTAPEVLSDNQINIEKLKELLGEERIAPAEHYELNWAGKTEARREIQKTSSHTLRPDANNPAHAQHMLIEGENLEVLRVLQKSYYGKVKMIYIDPPYNTGNDSFVYPDDYSEALDEYQKRTGEKSAEGYLNKQSLWKKNSKESGQYHSAWLSMMYPRLYLARNLLRDDGVIFISIDDNEAANLKLLCDEIFGAENFVGCIIWKNVTDNNPTNVTTEHEYVLVFSKNKSQLAGQWKSSLSDAKSKLIEVGKELIAKHSNQKDLQTEYTTWFRENKSFLGQLDRYKYIDVDGVYTGSQSVHNPGREGYRYDVLHPTTKKPCKQPLLGYRFPQETMQKLLDEKKILFGDDESKIIELKVYAHEFQDKLSSLIDFDGRVGAYDLRELFSEAIKVFNNPKPVEFLSRFFSYITKDDDIILDFFVGSGTTTQAVIELNLEDGGKRQSICVQMPEVLDETSEAYKAGYRTIADITRARIDKVIAKLKAEHPDKTADLACAHFTLAPSNFKVWRGDVGSADALREQLALFQSAEKAGQPQATDAQTAMLTELLLKHGLGALGVHAVSAPKQVAGVTVHRVLLPDDKHLWLCFEPYTDALKDELVKARPAQVVLLNSCFVGDKADEQLANLQLELAGLDIGLTVI